MPAPNIPPGGLDAEVKILRGPELLRLAPQVAMMHPGWDRRVTVWWTDGKDEHWPDDTEDTGGSRVAGQMAHSKVWTEPSAWDQGQLLEATVLVDLKERIAKSAQPAYGQPALGGVMQVSIYPFRHEVFSTLCHELLHVAQAWELGDRFGAAYVAETFIGQVGDPFNLNPRPGFGAGSIFDPKRGYFRNSFEVDARQFGQKQLSANITDLNDGKFDDILPIERMKKMLGEWNARNPVPPPRTPTRMRR